ncbi:hypothetical protein TOPH_08326 [Tolypocladium ophioglossoides CBS 100239]|uniref:Uncharacterized protein n=1 Tax=Tolypocladium ophioglossoides (strain CBS 100239) TaxID=1163406 RepID=A0A0L0MZX5_TOLOC|nr:hypothetical protein TOPH_08326 [Tolypocladium ophioglossoides CBS 100239]
MLSGHVTQRLASNILLATFPEGFDERKLTLSTLDIAHHRLDPSSHLAVGACGTRPDLIILGRMAPSFMPKPSPPRSMPKPLRPGFLGYSTMTGSSKTLPSASSQCLIAVSSSGGLDFSDDEIRHIAGQTAEGTHWLANRELVANVTFIYEQHNVTIPGDKLVPNTTMASEFSGVVYNDSLYCFHRYNVFDGSSWKGDEKIPSTNIGSGISAVVYDDNIYCFHQGSGSDSSTIWYNVFYRSSWKGDNKIPYTTTSSGPSAVVRDNCIFCFHKGSRHLCLAIFHEQSWTKDILIGGIGIEVRYRTFDKISTDSDYDTFESIWRNPVLKQLGYDQDYYGCMKLGMTSATNMTRRALTSPSSPVPTGMVRLCLPRQRQALHAV